MSFVVASRFNGPPQSGNGGYVAGLIASAIGETVAVRLHCPVPLERELTLGPRLDDKWEVHSGERLIATARPTVVDVETPAPPTYAQALEASKRYPGHEHHELPTCFVCGPARGHRDGLRIFPGPVDGTSIYAAPWIPDDTLDNGSHKARPEFVWAALDCPGYFRERISDPRLAGRARSAHRPVGSHRRSLRHRRLGHRSRRSQIPCGHRTF